MPLLLTSPAFPPGGEIPAQYTCDGSDISPPLSWAGAPAGTQSFVLILDDPDAPSGDFQHWAAFDIPAATPGLAAGYGPRPATGFREGANDFGKIGYGGPCPPPGGGIHHYHFRLFALNRAALDLAPGSRNADVARAAAPYVIERTELIGTYHR